MHCSPRFSRHGDPSQCVLQQYGCPLSVQQGERYPKAHMFFCIFRDRTPSGWKYQKEKKMYNIHISKIDYHENQRAISAKHDITTIIICKPRYFFCTTFTPPTPLRQLDRFGLSFETPNKLLGFIDAMVQPDDSIKAREAGVLLNMWLQC